MADPGSASEADDRSERRQRAVLWLLLLIVVVILLILFTMCAGGDDEAGFEVTTTRVPVETSTSTSATSTGAPTTTSAAPTTAAPLTTSSATVPTTTTAAPTTTEPGPIDVSGHWSFIVDVTVATGACRGEEDEDPVPDQVTIAQDGTALTVTGLNGSDPPWDGKIDGNTVTFSGERNEDDGRTVASFTLQVDDAATALTGFEDWTWSGPGGSCPDSKSVVSAERS